jgi:hypothetical protein
LGGRNRGINFRIVLVPGHGLYGTNLPTVLVQLECIWDLSTGLEYFFISAKSISNNAAFSLNKKARGESLPLVVVFLNSISNKYYI